MTTIKFEWYNPNNEWIDMHRVLRREEKDCSLLLKALL